MKVSEFQSKNPMTDELQQKIAKHLRQVEKARLVRAFENCGRCGHALRFEVETDHKAKKVRESGHCDHCQQRTPVRVYGLQ